MHAEISWSCTAQHEDPLVPTHGSNTPPRPHPLTHPGCSIEPADSSFNLVDPSKYNTSFGGLARIAAYVAAARSQAAAAGQDILVLHAGGLQRPAWAVPRVGPAPEGAEARPSCDGSAQRPGRWGDGFEVFS